MDKDGDEDLVTRQIKMEERAALLKKLQSDQAEQTRQLNALRLSASATPKPEPVPEPRSRRGFLLKQGGVRHNWKRRLFVLDAPMQVLRYYEVPDAVKTDLQIEEQLVSGKAKWKGSISLSKCTSLIKGTSCDCSWPSFAEGNLQNGFGLELPGRTYIMFAQDNDGRSWVADISATARLPNPYETV